MCRCLFYFPPLRKISGGMQVIADLAAHLVACGCQASLVSQKPPENVQRWLAATHPGVPLELLDNAAPGPRDWWIVPESWPLALKPGLAAGSRCVVYAQSWIYVHGYLPPGVYWPDLPVSFWAVSEPVAQFIRETTGREAPIVPPAIDGSVFYPPDSDESCRGVPAIAWMPRKNRGLAQQTRSILDALRRKRGLPPPEWVEIDGRARDEVADLLRGARLFFSSGFPEGCPLPPLEAMACGCLPCGFAGFGGWDYMRQGLPGGVEPQLALTPRSWGPNGFYVADADVFAAARALDYALGLWNEPACAVILRNAAATAAFYSPAAQKNALLRVLGLA